MEKECRRKRQTLQRSSLAPRGRGKEGEGEVPSILNEVLRSPGQPLDVPTRAIMEQRFGHDFSHVRVHTDAKAAESASAVNALPYTVERDVAFGVGQYRPQSHVGRRLMAHELSHVAQQSNGMVALQGKLVVSRPRDASEREANPLGKGANPFADSVFIGETLKTRPPFSKTPQPEKYPVQNPARVAASMQADASYLASSNFGHVGMPAGAAALPHYTVSKPVSSELVKLMASELVDSIRDRRRGTIPLNSNSHEHKPHQSASKHAAERATIALGQSTRSTSPVSLAYAKHIGEEWGSRIAGAMLNSRSHPTWGAFGFLPSAGCAGCASQISEVDDPGDSDDPTLMAVNGKTGCLVPLGLPWLIVTNKKCTAPCTLLHESTHFWDISPCCVRAGMAFRAAPPAGKAAVVTSWRTWISANRSQFECRAYNVSKTCSTAVGIMALCWAPERVVGSVIVGAAALAGGLIGGQISGAAGAGAGAGVGLAGGPAAPVTVPAGAAAGFISGELLGFLTGAGIGALAGGATEALRRKCCIDLKSYHATASSKIATHCGAAAATPCPF